jgi:hypothetical protein
MNGLGQGYCINNGLDSCSYARVKGVAAACGGGPKMLLRFINAGAFARFNISIDNHRCARVRGGSGPAMPLCRGT